MQISRLRIKNFRGIQSASIFFPKHSVLIGDNNTGKTTILEAIDLALGPDRLNRTPPIDEHDFYQGEYIAAAAAAAAGGDGGQPEEVVEAANGEDDVAGVVPAAAQEDGDAGVKSPRIEIEVTVTDLAEEQKARFGDYIEFWDTANDTFYEHPKPAGVDAASITEALLTCPP